LWSGILKEASPPGSRVRKSRGGNPTPPTLCQPDNFNWLKGALTMLTARAKYEPS